MRELEKIVTTAAILAAAGKPVALRDLPEPIARAVERPAPTRRPRRAAAPARRRRPSSWKSCCKRYDGNVADVSRELGKHRAAVWRWLKKFGIGPHKYRKDAGNEP